MGFPDEDFDSIRDNVLAWNRLGLQVKPFFATPYPGTEWYYANKDRILQQYNGDLESFLLDLGDATRITAVISKKFNAVELYRLDGPGGKVAHAEIKIGDSPIMLADEALEMGLRSAKAIGGSPISVMLYVEDVDALSAQAAAAGATVVRPVTDHFYGDRSGTFEDPFGLQWHISTHTEDVSPEELEKRMAAVAPA